MTRAVSSVLVVLLTVGQLAAQKPIAPPPETPIPERTPRNRVSQYAIAVRGCIQGKRLKMSQADLRDVPTDILRVSEFILDGPKELMQQLQEQHDKHYDEIEGIAIVPPSPNGATTSVTTKKKGPVRVAVGSREESGPAIVDAPRPITLRVSALTHLNEGCVPRP